MVVRLIVVLLIVIHANESVIETGPSAVASTSVVFVGLILTWVPVGTIHTFIPTLRPPPTPRLGLSLRLRVFTTVFRSLRYRRLHTFLCFPLPSGIVIFFKVVLALGVPLLLVTVGQLDNVWLFCVSWCAR